MDPDDLQGRLAFIRSAESLKDVLRSGFTSRGRAESTAEHTWRLCLLALVFEDRLTGLDFPKLLRMCLVHDLGEAIGGDIPATAAGAAGKAAQERRDLTQLLAPLPPGLRTSLLALWDEYEAAAGPEARAAKALDKLETLIQHNQGANPDGFDYAFNLGYGTAYTDDGGLFRQIRDAVDRDTRARMADEPASPAASVPGRLGSTLPGL
ncbi:MAG: HD domain-containing protein [Methylobacterium frigidaeris]